MRSGTLYTVHICSLFHQLSPLSSEGHIVCCYTNSFLLTNLWKFEILFDLSTMLIVQNASDLPPWFCWIHFWPIPFKRLYVVSPTSSNYIYSFFGLLVSSVQLCLPLYIFPRKHPSRDCIKYSRTSCNSVPCSVSWFMFFRIYSAVWSFLPCTCISSWDVGSSQIPLHCILTNHVLKLELYVIAVAKRGIIADTQSSCLWVWLSFDCIFASGSCVHWHWHRKLWTHSFNIPSWYPLLRNPHYKNFFITH